MSQNLLLFSSSRVANTAYLEHTLPAIQSFLESSRQLNTPLLFIPYAGVSISYQQYLTMVQPVFQQLGVEINSIHQFSDKKAAIQQASGLVTGGGNTFALLQKLYQEELIQPIKEQISTGTPYIGWSAGSNIAGPTIRTTNDMPIVQPLSFDALSLIQWQLNPHYIDGNPPGHNGETRQQRIEEFLQLNPNETVIGIAEGTALQINDDKLQYIGSAKSYLFNHNGKQPFENTQQLIDWLRMS
jgi:dipeptidase E